MVSVLHQHVDYCSAVVSWIEKVEVAVVIEIGDLGTVRALEVDSTGVLVAEPIPQEQNLHGATHRCTGLLKFLSLG